MTYLLTYVTEAKTGSIGKHELSYRTNVGLFFLRGEMARFGEAHAAHQTAVIDARIYNNETGESMILVKRGNWKTGPIVKNGLVDKLKLSERR